MKIYTQYVKQNNLYLIDSSRNIVQIQEEQKKHLYPGFENWTEFEIGKSSILVGNGLHMGNLNLSIAPM